MAGKQEEKVHGDRLSAATDQCPQCTSFDRGWRGARLADQEPKWEYTEPAHHAGPDHVRCNHPWHGSGALAGPSSAQRVEAAEKKIEALENWVKDEPGYAMPITDEERARMIGFEDAMREVRSLLSDPPDSEEER